MNFENKTTFQLLILLSKPESKQNETTKMLFSLHMQELSALIIHKMSIFRW